VKAAAQIFRPFFLALMSLALVIPGAAQASLEANPEGSFAGGGWLGSRVSGLVNNEVILSSTGNFSGSGGSVSNVTFVGSASTNLPGCIVEKVTNNTEKEGNEWAVSLSTPDSATISNITITYHYESGCAKFGVPSTVSMAGTATATVLGQSGCFEFFESGDLQLEGSSALVRLNGLMCFAVVTFE